MQLRRQPSAWIVFDDETEFVGLVAAGMRSRRIGSVEPAPRRADLAGIDDAFVERRAIDIDAIVVIVIAA